MQTYTRYNIKDERSLWAVATIGWTTVQNPKITIAERHRSSQPDRGDLIPSRERNPRVRGISGIFASMRNAHLESEATHR